MTEVEFKEKTGREPEQDDLERVNCNKVGQLGHWMCGWCATSAKPRFECHHCAKMLTWGHFGGR
jgi:hypothetical protein